MKKESNCVLSWVKVFFGLGLALYNIGTSIENWEKASHHLSDLEGHQETLWEFDEDWSANAFTDAYLVDSNLYC